MKKTCQRCGSDFICEKDLRPCWCTEFPKLPIPSGPGADCLCRKCLDEAVKQMTGDIPLVQLEK